MPSPSKKIALQGVFAENVRVERARRQWSQEQFAEIAGLTRSYVSKLELGKVNATLELVARIAEGLGLEPYQLLMHSSPQAVRGTKG